MRAPLGRRAIASLEQQLEIEKSDRAVEDTQDIVSLVLSNYNKSSGFSDPPGPIFRSSVFLF